MVNRIAQTISFVFHPFFIPLYSFACLLFTPFWFNAFLIFKSKLILLALIFSFTAIFPLINLLFFNFIKIIPDIYLKSSKDRPLPILIILIFYAALYYVLSEFQLAAIYKWVVLGAAVAILIVFIINFFTKVSAHLTAIGGLVGLLIVLSWNYQINFLKIISAAILISGLLAWSRLQLKAHSQFQVYLGFFIGSTTMISVLAVYFKIWQI
jgi:membrane-associated phospholipid phosphatase